jgi:hypothetical protein
MDEWLGVLLLEGGFFEAGKDRFAVFDPQKIGAGDANRLFLGITAGQNSIPGFAPSLYYVILRFLFIERY